MSADASSVVCLVQLRHRMSSPESRPPSAARVAPDLPYPDDEDEDEEDEDFLGDPDEDEDDEDDEEDEEGTWYVAAPAVR